MIIAVCFMLFGLLFIIPFIPGFIEIWRKTDAKALYINMNYVKDPCFFARSFKKKLFASLRRQGAAIGSCSLTLSKPETVEILEIGLVPDEATIENVYYIKQDLDTGSKVVFVKEVYVGGNVFIGKNNQIRALACAGNVFIQSGTNFIRWVDAEGSLTVAGSCNLGISASCCKNLLLAPNCSFKRLYGFPVMAGDFSNILTEEKDDVWNGELPVFEMKATDQEISYIPPRSREDCSFITVNSLTIGDHTLIRGHIKTHGNIVTGSYVTITGNIFAEGDIHLGEHSSVRGVVFSQGRIILDEGVTVGSKGKIKSVIGKRGISFRQGARVYGYVLTEGEGCVI